MSQHYTTADVEECEASIQIGWDDPAGWFYLVVEKVTDGDEPFYSNLQDTNRGVGELPYFLNLLKGWGVTLPEKMIDAIKLDKINHTVNRQEWWDIE